MAEKASNCPCSSRDCPRNRDCEKCQAYHKSVGSKTSCGK